MFTGVAVLPLGSAFPGVTAAAAAVVTSSSKAPANRPIFFVTAGERGILRIWSSLTGKCVYTHHGSSSSLLQQGPAKGGRKAAAAAAGDAAAAPGNEFVELLLLPGGKGLMAATGDARLLFFYPEVCVCCNLLLQIRMFVQDVIYIQIASCAWQCHTVAQLGGVYEDALHPHCCGFHSSRRLDATAAVAPTLSICSQFFPCSLPHTGPGCSFAVAA
jgi:hypothetical protein